MCENKQDAVTCRHQLIIFDKKVLFIQYSVYTLVESRYYRGHRNVNEFLVP
jgi:hypothetical protein